jgi:sugar phosphate isomerase/epimerase
MKIGFVTDEISPDINTALTKCAEWEIDTVEIRSLLSGRLPYISDEEKSSLLNLKKKFGIKVSAISPGIFRFGFGEKGKLKDDFEKTLPDSIRFCELLECKKMIIFGFRRTDLNDESDLDDVINEFGKIAEIASKYDIKIAIENGYDSWCKESKRILKIMNTVNLPNLGINWDPGNGVGDTEKPFPDTYEKIKNYIFNLHVKDTKYNNGFTCHVIGEGDIDWDGQIKSILTDIPDINMSIETHCEPLIENSEKNLKKLKMLVAKYKV